MAWRIELTASAAKVLTKLDKSEAKRIITFLRQRLAVLDDPRSNGKALVGPQFGELTAILSRISKRFDIDEISSRTQ